MRTFLNCSLFCILLLLTVIKNGGTLPLKDLMKFALKQLKQLTRKEYTKNSRSDDSVIHAIPSPDGQGFILQDYGKPYDPYAYDNNVKIKQTRNDLSFRGLMKFVLNQLKQITRMEDTKNNNFDDSVVYAIPSPDGQGFILQGYGKPHDPYAYDNNVNIRQTKKQWSGQLIVPNIFKKIKSYIPERTIKGNDNRIGMKISIPYLGDFQYLREMGPGRFIDNLGPGVFPYPGFNDKRRHHKKKPYYDPNYYGKDIYGNSFPDPYAEEDLQYISPDQKEGSKDYLNFKPKIDPFKGMRNYPWW